MNEYLTVDQVANMLNVTNATVTNLINRGRFPGAYKIDPLVKNSHFRIPREDVEKFIELQRGQGPKPQK